MKDIFRKTLGEESTAPKTRLVIWPTIKKDYQGVLIVFLYLCGLRITPYGNNMCFYCWLNRWFVHAKIKVFYFHANNGKENSRNFMSQPFSTRRESSLCPKNGFAFPILFKGTNKQPLPTYKRLYGSLFRGLSGIVEENPVRMKFFR